MLLQGTLTQAYRFFMFDLMELTAVSCRNSQYTVWRLSKVPSELSALLFFFFPCERSIVVCALTILIFRAYSYFCGLLCKLSTLNKEI